MSSQIGLIGLGTMGRALSRNLASHGVKLSLWNRTQEKITQFVEKHGEESFYAPRNIEDFVESLQRPRKIILMVPAGEPTQQTLAKLVPALEPGDVIMDGGNALFKVTEVYQKKCMEKGVYFLGTGISGGEEGALKGPSIMPGGSPSAWELMEPFLTPIAAEDASGKACVAYMGKGSAGHYVKMVHNGIEYAEMQMLAEAYDILHQLYHLEHQEIADIFTQWNQGPLESFLTEISIDVLEKKEDGQPLLDLILDKAKQKGTGIWTTQEALRLGVPVPSIVGAVFMRGLSNDTSHRAAMARSYPQMKQAPNMLRSECVEHLEQALLATRIANFEQGFALLRAAEQEEQFGLNFSEITRIWQGGCIIRCSLLQDMHACFEKEVKSLYLSDFGHKILVDAQKSWRRIVALATEHSIPLLAINGALSHFEAARRERLPANFIQGLRDRFGSHTYERVDQEGSFHTQW